MDSGAAVFDNERLADLDDLDDDGSTIRAVMRTFCQSSPEQFSLLVDACDRGDEETIARTAHRMKGSARTIGATALGDVCEALERTPDRATELTSDLADAHARTMDAARKLASLD